MALVFSCAQVQGMLTSPPLSTHPITHPMLRCITGFPDIDSSERHPKWLFRFPKSVKFFKKPAIYAADGNSNYIICKRMDGQGMSRCSALKKNRDKHRPLRNTGASLLYLSWFNLGIWSGTVLLQRQAPVVKTNWRRLRRSLKPSLYVKKMIQKLGTTVIDLYQPSVGHAV